MVSSDEWKEARDGTEEATEALPVGVETKPTLPNWELETLALEVAAPPEPLEDPRGSLGGRSGSCRGGGAGADEPKNLPPLPIRRCLIFCGIIRSGNPSSDLTVGAMDDVEEVSVAKEGVFRCPLEAMEAEDLSAVGLGEGLSRLTPISFRRRQCRADGL